MALFLQRTQLQVVLWLLADQDQERHSLLLPELPQRRSQQHPLERRRLKLLQLQE